jgi:hypothetical protein
MGLVRERPEQVLTNLFMPQMAKIFILLLKLDNVDGEKGRVWPSALQELQNLLSTASNQQTGKLYYKFLVKTILTLDEEVVERAESKSLLDLAIAG